MPPKRRRSPIKNKRVCRQKPDKYTNQCPGVTPVKYNLNKGVGGRTPCCRRERWDALEPKFDPENLDFDDWQSEDMDFLQQQQQQLQRYARDQPQRDRGQQQRAQQRVQDLDREIQERRRLLEFQQRLAQQKQEQDILQQQERLAKHQQEQDFLRQQLQQPGIGIGGQGQRGQGQRQRGQGQRGQGQGQENKRGQGQPRVDFDGQQQRRLERDHEAKRKYDQEIRDIIASQLLALKANDAEGVNVVAGANIGRDVDAGAGVGAIEELQRYIDAGGSGQNFLKAARGGREELLNEINRQEQRIAERIENLQEMFRGLGNGEIVFVGQNMPSKAKVEQIYKIFNAQVKENQKRHKEAQELKQKIVNEQAKLEEDYDDRRFQLYNQGQKEEDRLILRNDPGQEQQLVKLGQGQQRKIGELDNKHFQQETDMVKRQSKKVQDLSRRIDLDWRDQDERAYEALNADLARIYKEMMYGEGSGDGKFDMSKLNQVD